MKAFITGIGGFAGSHLAEHLLALGHQVSGLLLPGAGRDNIAHLAGRAALHEANLLDAARLRDILQAEAPDRVFHLAAQSSVSVSWEDPAATVGANVLGGLHLLEGCLPLRDRLRVVVVTSAEIYGAGPAGGVLREEAPFAPLNPYSVSKLALDLLAGQLGRARGLPVVRMRPANHAGPRQSPVFALARFARELARMEAGLAEPLLKVGNLDAARDFTDVRDIVRAYALAAERGRPGEGYLVCSGTPRRVGEALELLLPMAGVPVRVVKDPSLDRPADLSHGMTSCARLEADTGWRPVIPFEQTLRDTLDYWRQRLSRAAG